MGPFTSSTETKAVRFCVFALIDAILNDKRPD